MIHKLASVVALCGGLAAQGIVSPSTFGPAEATSWASFGIGGQSAPAAMLAIHGEMQGRPATITGVSFRREGQNTSSYGAFTMVVNVWVSTAATPPSAPSATFAQNHGPDKQQVVTFGLVQVPAMPPPTAIPAPFDLSIPFDQPLAWTGGGPLCLEIQLVSKSTTQTVLFDWVSDNPRLNPRPTTLRYGSGCIATGQTAAVRLDGAGTGSWTTGGVSLTYTGSRFPASAMVGLLIGGSNAQFAGLPLPLALPGTAIAPSGTCSLLTDALLGIPAVTNGSGQLSFSLGLAATPAFNGLSLFTQAVTLDATANSWGVVSSNGVQHQVLAPWSNSLGTVYATSSFGPTGSVRADEGFVCRFDGP